MKSEIGKRLSLRFVWEEVLAFLSWEKGGLYTAARLSLHPGKTVHAYLDGERKRLTNPVRFLLMTCAIVTAAFVLGMPRSAYVTEFQGADAADSWARVSPEVMDQVNSARGILNELAENSEERFLKKNAAHALEELNQTLMLQVAEISITWMNAFLLLALPINSLISWLSFRRAKLNIAEHIAANAYILGVQNVAAVLLVPLALFSQIDFGVATGIYMLASFIYQFVAWKQVFHLQRLSQYVIGFMALVLSVAGFLVLQGVAMGLIYAYAT